VKLRIGRTAVYKAYKKISSDGVYVLVFPDDIFKYVDVVAKYLDR